jgi:hypothetical protein
MMKKLTILLLLFIVFAFTEWDVDPDATDFTVDSLNAGKGVIERLTTDSTITNDFLLAGDTTDVANATGGLEKRDNKTVIWRDTISFNAYNPSFEAYSAKNQSKIWTADLPDLKLYIWGGNGIIFCGGGFSQANLDSSSMIFQLGKFSPTIDSIQAGGSINQLGLPTKRWGKIWTYELDVAERITGSSLTRGQATFSAVCLIDTVVVAGVTTNSFVFLTVKSTTAPTSDLSWAYLNTDSITVHCLAADTVLLRINPYCWFRIE